MKQTGAFGWQKRHDRIDMGGVPLVTLLGSFQMLSA
jgi:hypothetical protein